MSLVTSPLSPSELAALPLIADTQYLEEQGSVSINRKLKGIVPPGIYEGFTFAVQGPTSLRICPAGSGDHTAVIKRDGQVLTVQGQNPFDVTIPRSQNVAVVIEAYSAHGVLTKQIDKNAAISAAEYKVIPVGSVLSHHVIICTVNLPASGNLTMAHTSTATRTLGGLLNSLSPTAADARYALLASLAGGKKNAQLTKRSDADQEYHWLDVAGIAAAKDTATHIFEFHRNRYFSYERFGREPKQLTDLLSLNRGGTATYQSLLGLATAASNQPRIDYDPETGECLGLLTEPSKSRITTWPEDMTASSGNTGNWASIAPQKLVTIPGETSYSRKGFVKQALEILTAVWEISGTEQTLILLTIDNGNTAHCGRCSFNLLTGVLSGVQSQGDFTATVATARRIDSGFYRVELTTKTDSQLTGRLSIGVVAIGAVGGGGGEINVRRQWVERGGHGSSAILEEPAVAVATRLPDAGYVSMPFKMTRAFTIFLWARVLASDGSNMTLAIRNSENDYIGLQYVGSTNGTYAGATFVMRNGTAYSSVSAGNFKGQWVKIAVSGEPGRLSTYHNGVKLDHANGANFPGFNLALEFFLNFGGRGNGSVSNALTHIKEAWISPVATPDDILQSMSAY